MKRTPEDQANWQKALEWAMSIARVYGLTEEVSSEYKRFTQNKVLTLNGYYDEANCALYEWDI